MSEFEFEFNQKDKDLVVSQDTGTFTGTDYIRLTIYPAEAISNIVTLPNTNEQAIFYSSLNEQSFEINISPFGVGLDKLQFKRIGKDINPDTNQLYNDFQIYQNGDDVYIKPNEIFNTFELPEGNYKIQIDFLSQEYPEYGFIIKQISTSRKEVRLKLFDQKIPNNSEIIDNLKSVLNQGQDKYQFKHVLNVGTGDHNPIMNYQFDRVTDGRNNQSLILKLYEPLPTNVQNLSMVTIEKEVLTTQIQNIYYFSDVEDIFFGDGLLPDTQENWINPDNNNIGFENFDQLALSSSIGDIEINLLISSSEYGYPNLNTNFNEFTNHTFFGSVKKKLENFNKKVKTIQSHYSDISQSLSTLGISITGDSDFIISNRKNLFKKVNDEIKSFTPYENFLYFDGQSESTASAPGLGRNYVHTIPVNKGSNFEQLNQVDGFNVVYKNSNVDTINEVNLFDNKYKVHKKPFFNHSGSLYLSFILKGTDNLQINRKNDNHLSSGFVKNNFYVPYDSIHTSSILQPSVTGSQYRRFIFEASSSYYVPITTDASVNDMASLSETDFGPNSSKINILSSGIKTGSNKIKDSTNLYPITAVSQSGVPFKGSIMPAGDLFSINFTSGSVLTQSFITDVKVTLNDPTNVLPFDNVYHTSSNAYTTWYNSMLTKAETFDTDNIHSFENNLPLYIQNSSEYGEVKDFLNLQGEQYDLIRSHIDSLKTLHKRGYKKTDSPPNNTLPVLLSNMGWEAINPFSGSLNDSLGSFLRGVTSIDEVKNNIWRRNLNNLMYIYKTKGTKNSVRGLLNTYGYPPDILQFKEFGGSTEELNPRIFNNKPPTDDGVDLSLDTQTGSFSITSKKQKFYHHMFNGDATGERVLLLDWYYNDANINTLECVYKHVGSSNKQTLFHSKAKDTLFSANWDLSVVPSTSSVVSGFAGAPTAISYSFEFRLNNSFTGSGAIATNAVSMSTPFMGIPDGQLWNVMLQRMTASSDASITNEYRLHAALQQENTIQTYKYVTMSVSGSTVPNDTNFFANTNFIGTGSRLSGLNQNLHVGGQLPAPPDAFVQSNPLTGSLSEIRGWSTALSASKFRQHTLNKFSTVGNTINSHKDELVYHFKLNENWTTSSLSSSAQQVKIIDSSPTTTYRDYTFTDGDENAANTRGGMSVYSSSIVYGFDIIDTVKLTLQDNYQKENNKNVFTDVEKTPISNLNSSAPSVESLTNSIGKKPKLITSPKLEFYRSPQNYINDYILDTISGFNLETLYGNPINYYSQSYDEFDTFRDNFFEAHPIFVDTNQFIRAHEVIFNHGLNELLKKVVPARATFNNKNSNFGVEIKPTILEKQKYENEEHSVEANPNTGNGSIDVVSTTSVISSHYQDINIDVKEGEVFKPISASGSLELPYTTSISLGNTYVTSSGYLKDAPAKNHFHPPFLQPGGYVTTIENPYSASISPLPTYGGSTVVLSKDGTIDYASRANESYKSVHKNWGTSSNDTHFINYAGGTGSYGNYNNYHIDTRFHFYSIGDSEYYSASYGRASSFDDSTKFYNRLIIDNDFHADVTYDGKNFGTGSGIVAGRMMGKTRYFTTGSDGNIILPRNHVNKFSNPFKTTMYSGSKNTNPGFLNVRYEDYSSASFYRVKVTGGQNQIIVQSGTPGLAADDKIIYDDNSGGGGAL